MYIPETKPASSLFPCSSVSNSNIAKPDAVSVSPVKKLMNELKNNYQNIHFDFIDFKNENQIKEYASAHNGLNNVVISQSLLEKMTTDEALLGKVKNILDSLSSYQYDSITGAYLTDKKLIGMGLVFDENGEVSKWTKTEEIPEKQPFIPEDTSSDVSWLFSESTEKKEHFSIPYKYSHSYHMMRLASARNVTSVRGLIASGYHEIGKVKQKITDPKEAAIIIRKIKSVIHSGNIKIARLHKEEQLFRAERMAARRQKARLECQIAEQLRKKKIARKAQEHCQTISFDDIFAKPSLNDERYRQISGQYLSSSDISGIASLSSVMPAPPVSVPSADVSTSSVTTIDCSV